MNSLGSTALEIFKAVLEAVDARRAVSRMVRIDESNLWIRDTSFPLEQYNRIVSVSIGKAGLAMAQALSEVLGDKLSAGVVSGPHADIRPEGNWQVFAGGHPVPNEESLNAANAAIDLLTASNSPSTLVIYMISGGGSSMFERPSHKDVTLSDLRKTNRLLVDCGATINEVNKIRRRLSSVKGGKLSTYASRARQVTLLVSDTNDGDERSVASGPTIQGSNKFDDSDDAMEILTRFGILGNIPVSVMKAIADDGIEIERNHMPVGKTADDQIFLLLDNRSAIQAAVTAARGLGFHTLSVDDLVESSIEEGCAQLVSRLIRFRASSADGAPVCLVSGGEFMCKVHGGGRGGRNTEASLRCAIEIERQLKDFEGSNFSVAILNAGTDGVDGNCPAAGAISDEMSLNRARRLGLDPAEYLNRSDSYTFFTLLGDTIVTGATGTNVRDLRLLLAE